MAEARYFELINYTNKLVAQLNLHVCAIMLMDAVVGIRCTLYNFEIERKMKMKTKKKQEQKCRM